MTKDVHVSVTLAGRHSLEPSAVKDACEAVRRVLLDGTTEYTIQSFVPGHELARHGGRDGLGMVGVKIHESSFMAVWDAVSSFEAPASTLDEVCRCLNVTGEVHVRVNALVLDIPVEPLKIADGALAATFDATTLRLKPRSLEGNAGKGEIAFNGLLAMDKNETANIVIFVALKSDLPGVNGILGRALDTLSVHCEALVK